MYAESGDWQESAKVRKLMDEGNVKIEDAYSWIEIKNKTCLQLLRSRTRHAFLAGDQSHPLIDQVYLKLENLNTRLIDIGYELDTSYVVQDTEHKEVILAHHSDRFSY
ncbi:hypothetical protein Bca4012_018520 [Brassica carinata]|uniref:DYW domain-containing protein n=1 Tax=Brassica carinata TaxID=52824 RepID=A0A8X7WLI0_BRACI|nr:hypothetical protein Bca52824_003081 [Brassica carinata]